MPGKSSHGTGAIATHVCYQLLAEKLNSFGKKNATHPDAGLAAPAGPSFPTPPPGLGESPVL